MGLSFGVTMVWAPANFLVLQSNETRLPSGPLTSDEAVFVASIFAIGGLAGNVSYLWIVERFGRKVPLLLLAIPQIVRIHGWSPCSCRDELSALIYLTVCLSSPCHVFQISLMLIIFANNVMHLYVSRILCGYVGGACVVCIPIFTIEICYDEWVHDTRERSATTNLNLCYCRQSTRSLVSCIRARLKCGRSVGLRPCQLLRLCTTGNHFHVFSGTFLHRVSIRAGDADVLTATQQNRGEYKEHAQLVL